MTKMTKMTEIIENIETWEKIYSDAVNEYGLKSGESEEGKSKFFKIISPGTELSIEFLEIWAEKMKGNESISDIRTYLIHEIEKRKYFENE